MFSRLFILWDGLRTSLWFVPAVMALAAVPLAVAAIGLDSALPLQPDGDFSWIQSGRPQDAAALLTALLSAMITMTSLVFSVTMVVLTLAANHFGTRLIRSFMSDRNTQMVLGLFVMTIVYLVFVLRRLERIDGGGTPHLAVTLATGLVLLSIFVLIFFIHNVARSIDADTVVARVADELDDAIERLAPSDEADPVASRDEALTLLPDDFDERAAVLPLTMNGYVQAVDYGALASAATAHDALIRVDFRAGQYVYAGARRIVVYPAEAACDGLRQAVAASLLIGPGRTPAQDLEFSIRHLEEVAVRALSPGINDPYTAVAVIDRIGASIARLMGRSLHARVHRDDDGQVRVVAEATSYASLINSAFHQIRQNAADKPAVLLRLLRTLRQLSFFLRNAAQRDALLHHADLIAETGRNAIVGDGDRDELRRRHAETRCALVAVRLRSGTRAGDRSTIRAHGRGTA